jgi:2-keto-4-pentenoate hydratase/2-oxohepta-3-ene-1,7-dioic acid hydratase in catechol pathway
MFRCDVGPAFAALVCGEIAFSLAALHDRLRARGGRTVLSAADTVQNLLEDWERNFDGLQALNEVAKRDGDGAVPIASLRPVALIRPRTIFCAAANYSTHVNEMRKSGFTGGNTQPESGPLRPYHFVKVASCTTGAEDVIELPRGDPKIDWEIELAALIGRSAKHVAPAKALDYVAGYAVCNDVSCRAATWRSDRPNVRSDWLSGKSYDTFFPLGPYLVPRQFVADYKKLQLQLSLNGKLMQNGPASDMIFDLEHQIEYLTAMLTLGPGDVIATGTPAGVGQGQGQFLKAGDVIESTITGLGKQRNTVVAAAN